MELNDKEFDAAFRKKVFDADPQFEDAAWDKMEQKLRRRDRVILFRKSVLMLFVLLAGVWSYYALDKGPVAHSELTGNRKKAEKVVSLKVGADQKPLKSNEGNQVAIDSVDHIDPWKSALHTNPVVRKNGVFMATAKDTIVENQLSTGRFAYLHIEKINLAGLSIPADVYLPRLAMIAKPVPVGELLADNKAVRNKRHLPISMAISAGPEFNSASTVVGGDPGFSAGLTFGFGITKKLDLLTGVRYSVKKYNSGPGLRYNFPNTAGWAKYTLTNLDANCAVLEIPLQVSYNIINNSKNMVNLNAGISSYLMLKEDYDFKYSTSYGPIDKLLQKKNANQHLLSIVDLSATYFIKLKSTNLKLGLEPFVKIPLSGVGEGNINLKSSGVSLKLRYDLEKKSN